MIDKCLRDIAPCGPYEHQLMPLVGWYESESNRSSGYLAKALWDLLEGYEYGWSGRLYPSSEEAWAAMARAYARHLAGRD